MATRSFAVFQDEPSAKRPLPLGRSASAAAVLMGPRTSRAENTHLSERSALAQVPEKENLHPTTGLGVGPASASKKRKASESGSVLATKMLAIASGEPGASKFKRSELKRKASVSGKAKSKREPAKKGTEVRKVIAGGDTTSSSVQKLPSLSLSRRPTKALEPVSEEVEDKTLVAPVAKRKSITQALIDARCYELTVSPLADVTDAYLQSSEPKKAEEVKDEDLPEYRTVKEKSGLETQIRDYFSPEGSRSDSILSVPSSTSVSSSFFGLADTLEAHALSFPVFRSEGNQDVPSTPKKLKRTSSLPSTPTEKEEARASIGPMLSTPERKELYATFTFTTPKSSPARFK
ncbi:hypothetical protein M0805_001347 [Coniferiporia weirii]|nr:hypothetical protein M0805_001347 [Coniferiporia weirii]